MEESSVTEFAFIVRSEHIWQSFLPLREKDHSSLSSPEHEISSATFYPSLCYCLIFIQSCLALCFHRQLKSYSDACIQIFLHCTALLEKWHIVACGLPRSSALVLHVQEDFACVYVLEQNPNDSCLHRERWVLKKQKETLITASFRPTWPGDESMPALSLHRYQLQATVFHSGRQDTGLYRTLERLAWCFSFPYLHIFYHLLCKEGCKCKHRIHLC